MKGKGDALMGIGIGKGDNRAVDAATNAINNPLLEDAKIEGAKGILVSVTGGNDLCLSEYEEVLKIITANADDDALIIAGNSISSALNDQIKVTVIATGFKSEKTETGRTMNKNTNAEIISYEEWINMSKGLSKGTGSFLMSRNANDNDLNVPTVLRGKKVIGKKE